ncbi:hypothetical protein BLOT_002887 [Blomia tropicalis]|nr:hypothetical protein BLOT_002887 [Blomia tropicalis]
MSSQLYNHWSVRVLFSAMPIIQQSLITNSSTNMFYPFIPLDAVNYRIEHLGSVLASNNKPVSVMFLHDLILTFYAESNRQNSNPIVLIALTLIKKSPLLAFTHVSWLVCVAFIF